MDQKRTTWSHQQTDGSSCEIPQELRALEDKESEENNSNRSVGIIKSTRDELMTYNTSPLSNDISVKEKVAEEHRKGGGKRGGMRLIKTNKPTKSGHFAPTVSLPTVRFLHPA